MGPGRHALNGPSADPRAKRLGWRDLSGRARAWRAMHAGWSVAQLACLGLIWHRAVTGRRDRALWASVAFLGVEGGALVIGRGNCPMGERQESWGDPVPFFELILPPRAAKAAVPVLAAVSVAGMVAIAVVPHCRTSPVRPRVRFDRWTSPPRPTQPRRRP